MKKMILMVLLLVPAALMAQTVNYTFKAHIGTAPGAPSIAYLIRIEGGVTSIDSITPVNGRFTFTGTLNHPAKATLMIKKWTSTVHPKSYSDKIPVYLENGVTTMETADSLIHATFTGSPLNIDNQALLSATKKVERDYAANMAKFHGLSAEQRKDPETARQIKEAADNYTQQLKQAQADFIAGHPASYVSFYVMKAMVGAVPDYDEASKVFSSLSPALRNTPEGRAYATQLDNIKTAGVGSIAPDFVQNDVNGKPVKLSSFRGKYVLVDFWASWCGPCRAENPNVLKAYHEFKDKNFTVLGVSLDKKDDRAKWLKAIADDHLEWTQVSDLAFFKNAAAVKYGVTAIPQNFLIDPQGKIVAKDLRGEELQKTLMELTGNSHH